MFRLVKQPCTDFIPLLLAELERISDPQSTTPLYVRNGNQGAIITTGDGRKNITVQVWGAVSVNVHCYINGALTGTSFAGTTSDVEEAAKTILDWVKP